MSGPRRPRVLTSEEARLWAEIAKLVKPLRGRARPASVGAEPNQAPAPAAVSRTQASKPSVKPAAAMPDRQPTAQPAKRPFKLAEMAASLSAPSLTPRRPLVAKAHAAPPPPPGLERRERMGLSRGTLAIEARIDLHGMRQSDAHDALIRFLQRARAEGRSRVLVVTGKGSDDAFAERGVLRRSVPHWLRGGELRALVLGFEQAARHHGGAGALYVRLRRR